MTKENRVASVPFQMVYGYDLLPSKAMGTKETSSLARCAYLEEVCRHFNLTKSLTNDCSIEYKRKFQRNGNMKQY